MRQLVAECRLPQIVDHVFSSAALFYGPFLACLKHLTTCATSQMQSCKLRLWAQMLRTILGAATSVPVSFSSF